VHRLLFNGCVLAAFDATSFLQMTGKGGEVQAVIEAVSNGGMLRATLLPDYQLATVVSALLGLVQRGK